MNNIDYVRLDVTFDSNVKHFKSNKPKASSKPKPSTKSTKPSTKFDPNTY